MTKGGGDGADIPHVDGGFQLAPFLSSSLGLAQPVFLTHAGDGSGRLFVVEQGGLVRVVKDGRLLDEPFLDLAAGGQHPLVTTRYTEQGLLGLAFHPDYATNGRFFVQYNAIGGDLTTAEYRNPEPADDVADPATARILLTIEHSDNGNHNGGMLAFGPDGMLYIGTGDGGAAGDPPNNAQDLDSLLGKILRIDVSDPCADPAGQARPYCVPQDNPFVGVGRSEVWDYGLRNPWRFSFDRGAADGEGRGDLWIGDVGQNKWEEVDHEPAGEGGRNYGWSRFEGTHQFSSRTALDATDPVAEYSHTSGGGSHCAVTGGHVYRGAAIPALQGAYLLGDFCSGFLWTVRDGKMGFVEDTALNVSSFGEDEDGELYVVDLGGEVHKVVPG